MAVTAQQIVPLSRTVVEGSVASSRSNTAVTVRVFVAPSLPWAAAGQKMRPTPPAGPKVPPSDARNCVTSKIAIPSTDRGTRRVIGRQNCPSAIRRVNAPEPFGPDLASIRALDTELSVFGPNDPACLLDADLA